tara:strand:+ start:1527 stop:1679 length:153 start_codon:yes stop_codon:yes gene_type:complete
MVSDNSKPKTIPLGVAKWILKQQLADENFEGMYLLLDNIVSRTRVIEDDV